jgi:hypothetical protein
VALTADPNALEIGKKLKSMKYSGGFEIMAMAYADDDQKDKAIECLEEGVKTCPDVWILWQMLGNYRSDQDNLTKPWLAMTKLLPARTETLRRSI